jgi:hypothetical protein
MDNEKKVVCISRLIGLWILSVGSLVMFFSKNNFVWGPNDSLEIMGFHIDTWSKYMVVICYVIVNTIVRSVDKNVLQPYLLLHVQNDSYEAMISKPLLNKFHMYQLTFVNAVYTWFDWYLYMQILLTQWDFVLIECIADTSISIFITYNYLSENTNVYRVF